MVATGATSPNQTRVSLALGLDPSGAKMFYFLPSTVLSKFVRSVSPAQSGYRCSKKEILEIFGMDFSPAFTVIQPRLSSP